MKKRVIAYHLPQFHEIEENNIWWGKGYTEWTAIRRWKPYFKGHQLRKPSQLGYYDLMDASVLESQYKLASSYGIEGFCFWAYWFGAGERLLEKPLQNLLLPGSQVKYCFAWANHSWWDKSTWRLLKEQKYLGREDYISFYKTLSNHFNNPNYIKKDNKLLLTIFAPEDIPDLKVFISTFNELAKENGYDGFYFISDKAIDSEVNMNYFAGYTNSLSMLAKRNIFEKIKDKVIQKLLYPQFGPIRYSYRRMMANIYRKFKNDSKFIPIIFTGWDSTPRHGKRGIVLTNFNPETFQEHVKSIFQFNNNEFIFIKSWNEWAEGNLLEPDDIYQLKLLEVIKNENS